MQKHPSNEIMWKDLVKVNGVVKEFTAPVTLIGQDPTDLLWLGNSLEQIDLILSSLYDNDEPLYDCEPYLDAAANHFGIDREKEDIETYLFGNITDQEVLNFDINTLGGYINGIQY